MRETIGWKYNSKPPAGGGGDDAEEKPTASRSIGMLCREFFIGMKLREPSPAAPGLAPAWELHNQRRGDA